MNNINAPKMVPAEKFVPLYNKYQSSNRYDVIRGDDQSSEFTVRENTQSYALRIVKGITYTVFTLGIAYYKNQDVRDLFNERKIKTLAREALQTEPRINAELQIAIEHQEEGIVTPPTETIPTQINSEPTLLEEPTIFLEEIHEEFEAEVEIQMIDSTAELSEEAIPQTPINTPITVEVENKIVSDDSDSEEECASSNDEDSAARNMASEAIEEIPAATVAVTIADEEARQRPQKRPQLPLPVINKIFDETYPQPPKREQPAIPAKHTSFEEELPMPPKRQQPIPIIHKALEDELPPPPIRIMNAPNESITTAHLRGEEPLTQPPMRTIDIPTPQEMAAAAETARALRLESLSDELQEKSIAHMTALRFTLEVLGKQKIKASKSNANRVQEIVTKLENLVATAEQLRNALIQNSDPSVMMNVFISTTFASYSDAVNSFIVHYNEAEALCRKEPLYTARGRPSDAIQTTYQFLTRQRLFVQEFARLDVASAAEALQKVETSVQAMNLALVQSEEAARQKPAKKSFFDDVESLFDDVFN